MKFINNAKGISSSIIRYILNVIDSPVVVLIYHRVLDADKDPQQLCVSKENFHSHIQYLKKNFNVLSPDGFYEMLVKKNNFKSRSVLITFDDGYYDNFENALPVLKSLDAGALFFVSTSNIGKDAFFFWDELELIFKIVSDKLKTVDFEFAGLKISCDWSTPESKMKSFHKIHREIKYSKEFTRRTFLKKFREACNIDDAALISYSKDYRVMKSEEIKEISSHLLSSVGAHTHTHSPLNVYGYNEQYSDITISKNKLEEITGRKIEYFSYPFGSCEDYDHNSLEICRELGFKLAFSNFYGQTHRWTDKFQIPRMLVRNWETDHFKKQMDKFFLR